MLDAELRQLVKSAVREVLEEMGYRPPEPAPELCKLGEVNRYIRVSKTTVKQWLKSGELKRYGEGRLTRVRLDEVRAVLERRRLKVVQEPPADVARILASVPKVSSGRIR
jgi:excisionase family DNA binding protein